MPLGQFFLGILLINANILASLLILLVVKLEQLFLKFLSPLPPCSMCLAGRQFHLESIMETAVLQNRSHPSWQTFFEFLGTRKYPKDASPVGRCFLHTFLPTTHIFFYVVLISVYALSYTKMQLWWWEGLSLERICYLCMVLWADLFPFGME